MQREPGAALDLTTSRPSDDGFSLEDYPFYLMNQAAGAYNDAMKTALAGAQMTQLTWRILLILRDEEPLTVSDIATKAATKLSTVTRAVQRMAEDGLVECSEGAVDRRVTLVERAKKGRIEAERVRTVADSVFLTAIAGVSEQDLYVFNDVLRRIRTNLKRPPHAPADWPSPPASRTPRA
ncbi:MAG: MarR family winged helix-turn-helix transcriptional regulator [Pseudomonadota bacterium]